MEEKKNSPFSTITINKDMLNDLESHQCIHDSLMRTKTVTCCLRASLHKFLINYEG